MACLTLVVDAFSQDPQRKVTYILSQLTLVVLAILIVYLHTGATRYAFGSSFVSDDMSVALKAIICMGVYSYKYLVWRFGEKRWSIFRRPLGNVRIY